MYLMVEHVFYVIFCVSVYTHAFHIIFYICNAVLEFCFLRACDAEMMEQR